MNTHPRREDGNSCPPAILVVDDEQLIRWSIRAHLEQAGFKVVVAENGKSALDSFDENVRLALVDFRLPDTDGLELIRRLKQQRPDCQVILMTAFGSPEVAEQAVATGAFRVVDKPFNLDDMTHLVEEALHSIR